MSEIAELYRSDNYSHRVAAEVRSHAARQGILQKDLAKALGYVPSQITKRLRGQVPFTLDELAALARVFDIEPAELMPPRPPVIYRPKDGADTLPRLDLNQQPFGYPTLLVSGSAGAQLRAVPDLPSVPCLPEVPLYPNVVPFRHPRPGDSQPATRQEPGHTFRPVILEFPNRVTA